MRSFSFFFLLNCTANSTTAVSALWKVFASTVILPQMVWHPQQQLEQWSTQDAQDALRKNRKATVSQKAATILEHFFIKLYLKLFYTQLYQCMLNAWIWNSASKKYCTAHQCVWHNNEWTLSPLPLHWGANLIENQQLRQMKSRRLTNTSNNTKTGDNEMVRHSFFTTPLGEEAARN